MICEEVLIDIYIYTSSTNSLSQTALQLTVPEEGSFECLMSLHGSEQDVCL